MVNDPADTEGGDVSRTILITGSAGHLGRALRAAFEAQGDRVHGIDVVPPVHPNDLECDLDDMAVKAFSFAPFDGYDILICNAKVHTWEVHHALATRIRQSVINVSSIYGALGPDPKMYDGTEIEITPAWYAASKSAMIGLTKYQATTLAPVRSNCVVPGGIFRGQSKEFEQRYSAKVPLGRMAVENDIVGPIMFLCSDAAAYITGAVLVIDGGLSIRA